MSAEIRPYEGGDFEKVKGSGLEELFDYPMARTITERSTGEVLACFGARRDGTDGGAYVWVEFSPRAKRDYKLYLAKTMVRYMKSTQSSHGFKRFWSLVRKSSPSSIRFMEWLGFERGEMSPPPSEHAEFLMARHIYFKEVA